MIKALKRIVDKKTKREKDKEDTEIVSSRYSATNFAIEVSHAIGSRIFFSQNKASVVDLWLICQTSVCVSFGN